MFCNIGHVCTYASRTATSFWLSTGHPIPMMPVGSDHEVKRHISRCAVCQSPAPLLTIHSQTTSPAQCPEGWSTLWHGYSFVMVSTSTFAEKGLKAIVNPCHYQIYSMLLGPWEVASSFPVQVAVWRSSELMLTLSATVVDSATSSVTNTPTGWSQQLTVLQLLYRVLH